MPEFQSVRAASNATLVALLGRETFEELEAYKLEFHFDWTIGTDLWDGGAPLTNDELHALALAIVRIGYDDQVILTAPKPAQVPHPTTWLSQQDNALLTATDHFLSPLQQELLRKNLVEENRYNTAMRGAVAQHATRSVKSK